MLCLNDESAEYRCSLAKKTLRKEIREEKRRHTEGELAALSEEICLRLMSHPKVSAADVVLLYWALPDEVCTHGLVRRLAEMGKTVLLPRVVSDTGMTLHRFTAMGDMARGRFGILEPQGEEVPPLLLGDMRAGGDGAREIVGIIPGMAFDRHGHRLGRGKGYYDRLLALLPWMYRIGVCYPFQMQESVPAEATDVAMDEVVCGQKRVL